MTVKKHKVVLAFTEQSRSEPDLRKMIEYLCKSLGEISNVAVEEFVLTAGQAPPASDHLVLCGYDHVTLAHLHLALSRGDRVTMYDEPGRSLKSELDAIFYRGVDVRRLPASTLSAVEYCWNGRDIISVTKLCCGPKPRSSPRTNRSRQVEDNGATPARERTTADTAGGGDNREDG